MTGTSSWRAHALGLCLAIPMALAHVSAGSAQGVQLPVPRVPQAGPRIQPPQQQQQQPGMPNVQVRTLEVRDVTFGSPGSGSLTIGRIAFIGLVRGADAVRAERVEFESISGGTGTFKVEIPAINVLGFEAPIELFRALSEGGAVNLDWPALIQRAAATEISADVIRDEETTMRYETNYHGLVLKNLRNGRLQSAKLDRTVAQSDSPIPAERFTVGVGETLYEGLDFSEWIRFVTGGGSGGAKPLLERVTVKGLDLNVADVAMRVEKIEVVGFDGRAPAEPFPMDLMAAAAAAQPDPETMRRFAAYFGDVIRHMRVARYSWEGISVTAMGQGPFVIGALNINGSSGRGIELLELKGIDLPAPTGQVKLDRFALEKLSYGALVDLGLQTAASGAEPDITPEKIVGLVPRFAAIRLAGLAVDTPAGPMALGEFRFELDDRPGVIPERMATGLKRLKVQLADMPPDKGRDELIALGYNELLADTQVQLRWLRNERALVLDDSGLSVDRLGRLDLTARLGDVDLAAVAADPDAAEGAMNRAKVESLGVRLINLGLAERLFGQLAHGSRISPDAVRAGVASEFRAQATAMLGPALTPGSAEAIEAFIRAPTRIEARATTRPGAAPLTVGEAQRLAPPQLLERLSITIAIPPN